MSKKFTISFKETTKDTELLVSIKNLEEKSQTIKDILYKSLVEKREFR
ncbi:hypothetical protein [Clostridium sp. ZS2]|nr:hypothetical protein [Clostridium sp. ZS2]